LIVESTFAISADLQRKHFPGASTFKELGYDVPRSDMPIVNVGRPVDQWDVHVLLPDISPLSFILKRIDRELLNFLVEGL
jgi:hypothetical protein